MSKSNKNNPKKNPKKKKNLKELFSGKYSTHFLSVFVLGLIVSTFFFPFSNVNAPEKVKYAEFVTMFEAGEIDVIKIEPSSSTFSFMKTDKAEGVKKNEPKKIYSTDNPRKEGFKNEILTKSPDTKFIEISKDKSPLRTLISIAQLAFFALFGFYIFRMLKTMKPSETQVNENAEECTVRFKDIAGNEEAKEDMSFLVDFLKEPKRYEDAGAALPSGAILYGPPGTGKTLMAKAIAGEAGVPFFSVSGSDFTEMFVGMGAKRVRDLFEAARKKAPSIIFIDEIDSIGGKRSSSQHSEQRQTLNAILKELDGFTSNTGVIVIGATNRLEDLDTAFIRPGRFDKHIAIGLPEQKDRLAILQLHAEGKKLAKDVDLQELSKITIGLAGAGLESIVNEAAILSVRKKEATITAEHIEEAYFNHVMKGHQKKTAGRDTNEIELVAWHEAGHALVAKMLTNHDVPKVTIISSTSGAGGVTFMTPTKMGLHTKHELKADIQVLYAGRIAEELWSESADTVTTGASRDIEMASQKIRDYLIHYGMSESFGMINPEIVSKGEESGRRVLEEASKLSATLYSDTFALMSLHYNTLKHIAEALIEKESLTSVELDQIIDSNKTIELVEA